MSGDERYGAMTFVHDGRGGLREGRLYSCRDVETAKQAARRRVERGFAAGATAFSRVGGGEYDEGEMIIHATFGDVPPEIQVQVPF